MLEYDKKYTILLNTTIFSKYFPPFKRRWLKNATKCWKKWLLESLLWRRKKVSIFQNTRYYFCLKRKVLKKKHWYCSWHVNFQLLTEVQNIWDSPNIAPTKFSAFYWNRFTPSCFVCKSLSRTTSQHSFGRVTTCCWNWITNV